MLQINVPSTASLSRYKGIVFDFNGVLFWDNPLHEEAWRQYSAHLRGHPLTDREMIDQVHGRVNHDIFTYVLGRDVARDELQRLAGEKEDIYRNLCLGNPDAFHLSPGATELLDFLVEQRIPHTIATSSAWPNVAFYLEHLELERWFERPLLVYDEGRYAGKPAPFIYLEAAERLGLSPAECVVVEDALAGIAAARAAGIGHIVALGPERHHAELAAQPGVSEVIRDLGQFPRHLLEGARRAGARSAIGGHRL